MNLPRNTTLWKLGGADSFRLASTMLWKNWLQECGTNLTNIEKSMRKLYYADYGKRLAQVDQAGAEALIVAYLCRPGRYRELFDNNVKPHVFVAMTVFLDKWKILCKDIDVDDFARTPISQLKAKLGWDILDRIIKDSDNWSPSERYYFIAKMIVHASSYGMKGGTFQMNVLEKSRGQVVLTKKQSDTFLDGFHSLFPEIKEWHRDVIYQIKEFGIIYNMLGFPRQLTGHFDEFDAKDWFAWAPQSTVGCITHVEITNERLFIDTTHRALTVHPIPKLPEPVIFCLDTFGSQPADWDILGNNHDSSLSQAPEDDIMRLVRVKHHLMCQDLTAPRGEKFKMRAECQIGRNWAPKKESNPDGLVEIKL
jgi:hypothetical protein